MNGDKPFIDPQSLTPEEWQGYLKNAMQALRQNPKDREALQAVQDANQALSVYDAAEAASPGERITSGVKEGLAGLGDAALDIPRGIGQAVVHPIETLKGLPHLPGALYQALSSDDPRRIARAVGNVGSLLAPGAKASTEIGLGAGADAPTVAAVIGRAASAPGRVLRAVFERPELKNQLLRAQIANASGRVAGRIPRGAEPPPITPAELENPVPETPLHPDAVQAMRDFDAGKISGEDLRTALDVAAGRRPGVISDVPEEMQPIPKGPPGPPAPDQGTIATAIRRGTLEPSNAESITAPWRLKPPETSRPYYPRGGAVEQAQEPLPQRTPNPASGTQMTNQLRLLLQLPTEELESARGLIPGDILRRVLELKAAGATPADVP